MALGLTLLLAAALPLGTHAGDQDSKGMLSIQSDADLQTTVDRLVNAVEQKGLRHFATINHGDNVNDAGLELRGTVLVIFGNPAMGGRLMQVDQAVAIDLPQRMLVWEGGDGSIWVGWNDPLWLARRHGIPDDHKIIDKFTVALRKLAGAAAGE
jgi:uncharacterized protein (DUF302 family)